MNRKYLEARRHVLEHGCGACQLELDELGPELGPEPPLNPRIERWSMTKEEWYGQEPVDAPY